MNTCHVTVEAGFDEALKIMVLSDVHVGSVNCDYRMFERTVSLIERVDYVLLNGDLGDCIHAYPLEQRFRMDMIDPQRSTPQEQFQYLHDAFQSYIGKFILITDGNHEEKWSRRAGFDISRMLAGMLKAEYSYGFLGNIIFNFRGRGNGMKRIFEISMSHGKGSAKTEAGRVRSLISLASSFPYADIYLMGHYHELGKVQTSTELDDKRKPLTSTHKYFAFTGGFLRGYVPGRRSYIEGLKPTTIGALLILVTPFPSERKMPPIVEFREIMENGGFLQIPRELK